jgi:hypothetical protein
VYIWNQFRWVRLGIAWGLSWKLPGALRVVHRDDGVFNSISTCDRILFYTVGNILATIALISVSCCVSGVCVLNLNPFCNYRGNSLGNKYNLSDASLWHTVQRPLTFLQIQLPILLECGAESLGDWCPTFRNSVLVPSSRVEYPMKNAATGGIRKSDRCECDLCWLASVDAFFVGYLNPQWGRDSSIGIATRNGLDGLGIESRCGRNFPHLSRPALSPTEPPIQWVTGLSRG